jgi:hypothetical protein
MSYDYFVVVQDFGRRGLEATVHPEETKRDIIDLIKCGEYETIAFIHRVHDGICEDLTEELLAEAVDEKVASFTLSSRDKDFFA